MNSERTLTHSKMKLREIKIKETYEIKMIAQERKRSLNI
jgi:hypothetical protein